MAGLGFDIDAGASAWGQATSGGGTSLLGGNIYFGDDPEQAGINVLGVKIPQAWVIAGLALLTVALVVATRKKRGRS